MQRLSLTVGFRGVRRWLTAALLVGGALGYVSLVARAARLAADPATEPEAAVVAVAETTPPEAQADDPVAEAAASREAILQTVRRHRRGASDAWQQQLADSIYNESVAAEIDPLMVASIVAKESSFKSRAVSRARAIGLMQLRPFVAKDLARRHRIEWRGVQTLHDPDLNVRLGILYYKELVSRFEGDHRVALTAYNYGPTRVSRQLRSGTYSGSAYAERILGFYEEMHDLRSALAGAGLDAGFDV